MRRRTIPDFRDDYLPDSDIPEKYPYPGGFAEFKSTDQSVECRFFKEVNRPDDSFEGNHALLVFRHFFGTCDLFLSSSRVEKGLVLFCKEAQQKCQLADCLLPVKRNPELMVLSDQQAREWIKKLRIYLQCDRGFGSEFRTKVFNKTWSGTPLIQKMRFAKVERECIFY